VTRCHSWWSSGSRIRIPGAQESDPADWAPWSRATGRGGRSRGSREQPGCGGSQASEGDGGCPWPPRSPTFPWLRATEARTSRRPRGWSLPSFRATRALPADEAQARSAEAFVEWLQQRPQPGPSSRRMGEVWPNPPLHEAQVSPLATDRSVSGHRRRGGFRRVTRSGPGRWSVRDRGGVLGLCSASRSSTPQAARGPEVFEGKEP
jgi:hypothetical protein